MMTLFYATPTRKISQSCYIELRRVHIQDESTQQIWGGHNKGPFINLKLISLFDIFYSHFHQFNSYCMYFSRNLRWKLFRVLSLMKELSFFGASLAWLRNTVSSHLKKRVSSRERVESWQWNIQTISFWQKNPLQQREDWSLRGPSKPPPLPVSSKQWRRDQHFSI